MTPPIPQSPARKPSAFTMVELLVVITLIVLLITLLLPSLKRASEVADVVTCQTHQRQIVVAWVSYAFDNASVICSASPGTTYGWVASSGADTPAGLRNGTLGKYLDGDFNIFLCPKDPRPERITTTLRSYSFSGYANGDDGNYWLPRHATRMSHFASLGTGMLMMEEGDPRGYNMGSWVTRPTGPDWVDWPADWHYGNGSMIWYSNNYINLFGTANNVTFADGHTECYRFQDNLTNTINSFYLPAPGSKDQQYYQRIYWTDPSR